MKTRQFSDIHWMVRFAPYTLAVSTIGLVLSLLWFQPVLHLMLVGFASGILVFIFHVLGWRSGRGVFQTLAMASIYLPLLYMISRHQPFAVGLQYVAMQWAGYGIAAILFRGRVLKKLIHDS